MNIQTVYSHPGVQRLLIRRRHARARFFLSKVEVFPEMSVLDVGCGVDGNSLEAALPDSAQIVGIDLLDPDDVRIRRDNFIYFQQDAQDLTQFDDDHFDLAVSIGMLEHICDRAKLMTIAEEMIRVARQVVIVVPWKYAWLEPHFKIPFFQLLPWTAQLTATRLFNCNGLGGLAGASPAAFKRFFEESYQWLPTSEWKRIFRAEKAFLNPTLETITIVKRMGRA
jgi:ubiquinone/menaquinone biosynthesis C-methylase UbiE